MKGASVALRMFCLLLLLAAATFSAPFAKRPSRLGIPHDWTERHLIFSRQELTQHPELARAEPRLLFQAMRQQQMPVPSQSGPTEENNAPAFGDQRDWNVSLGTGHVAFGMSPAK